MTVISPEAPGGTEGPNALFGIDAPKALSRLGGNRAFFTKLLERFVTGSLYKDFIASLETENASDIRDKAHALKGVAANLSLTPLFEHIAALEQESKDGAVIRRDDPRLKDLERVYQKTMDTAHRMIENPALV